MPDFGEQLNMSVGRGARTVPGSPVGPDAYRTMTTIRRSPATAGMPGMPNRAYHPEGPFEMPPELWPGAGFGAGAWNALNGRRAGDPIRRAGSGIGRFLGDESGSLKLPAPGGEGYPLAENSGYRARQQAQRGQMPGQGIPRASGTQPYRVGGEADSLRPSLGQAEPPGLPKYDAATYDPVAAYQQLQGRLGNAGAGPEIPNYHAAPIESLPPTETFAPDIFQAATVGNQLSPARPMGPLGRAAQGAGEAMMARPQMPINLPHLAGAAGLGGGLMAADNPEAALHLMTHPGQAASGLQAQLTHPEQTWQPGFTEGLVRLLSGGVSPLEFGQATGEALGMGAAWRGGQRIGNQMHQNLARFGTGYTADTLGAGLNRIKNTVSDAWHDPGGQFGR